MFGIVAFTAAYLTQIGLDLAYQAQMATIALFAFGAVAYFAIKGPIQKEVKMSI